MTREEFTQILDRKDYSYEIEGDKIVITGDGIVILRSLVTIPPGVEFKNRGSVYFESLETIPSGVEFNNRGDVYLGIVPTKQVLYYGGLPFSAWEDNIEGIDSSSLLNSMINKEIFI
jgi:hypothetical protein